MMTKFEPVVKTIFGRVKINGLVLAGFEVIIRIA